MQCSNILCLSVFSAETTFLVKLKLAYKIQHDNKLESLCGVQVSLPGINFPVKQSTSSEPLSPPEVCTKSSNSQFLSDHVHRACILLH